MPRSPALNRDIRDARRDAILAAALKLFARRGFTDTKIGEIAEAAGLSHGLVYHYFPSKTAIFEELILEKRREAWARVDAAALEGSHALRGLLESALQDAHERPDVTLMVTQALLTEAIPEPTRRRLRDGARDGFDRSVALLEQAQARGEVDAGVPAAQLASTLFCCLRGIVLTCHGGRGLDIPAPTADTLLRMIAPRPGGHVVAAKSTAARAHSGRGQERTTSSPTKKAKARTAPATRRDAAAPASAAKTAAKTATKTARNTTTHAAVELPSKRGAKPSHSTASPSSPKPAALKSAPKSAPKSVLTASRNR